jgi:hypothetical protein
MRTKPRDKIFIKPPLPTGNLCESIPLEFNELSSKESVPSLI